MSVLLRPQSTQELDELHHVLSLIDSALPEFVDFHRRAARNLAYFRNEQWASSELANFQRQGRIPYVWNRIANYILNIVGMQIQTRTDVSILPVEKGDEYLADLLLRLYKWAESINNLDRIETDVFMHGLIQGAAFTQCRWEFIDFYGGAPYIERVPVYQIFWDLSARESDLSDAAWMARAIPMYAKQAKELLPDYADVIDIQANNLPSYPGSRLPFYETFHSLYSNLDYPILPKDYGIVWVIEAYEKHREKKYAVVNEISGDVEIFDTERQAKSYLAGTIEALLERQQFLTDEQGRELVYIVDMYRDNYMQRIIIGDRLVSSDETDLVSYPFQTFFPIFVEGRALSPVDILIYPQKFLNRMISEWDNVVGRSSKGLMTVIEELLPPNWNAERVAQARSRAGATIPVKRHEAIQERDVPPAQTNFAGLVQLVTQYMMEMAGGNNIFGLQENAAESGRAVRSRQAAAGLSRVPYFSAIRDWKKQLTEYVIWSIKEYMTSQQLRRIIGEDIERFESQKVEDVDILETIRSIRTDIAITPAVESDLAREEMYNQVLQFMQSGGGTFLDPATQLYLLLELNPAIPSEVKDKIREIDPFFKELRQKQQQEIEQQQMQQSVEKSLAKSLMKKQLQNDLQQ